MAIHTQCSQRSQVQLVHNEVWMGPAVKQNHTNSVWCVKYYMHLYFLISRFVLYMELRGTCTVQWPGPGCIKKTSDYGRFSATALCVLVNFLKALWFFPCFLVHFLPIYPRLTTTGENLSEHNEWLQKISHNLKYFYATGPRFIT